MAVSDDQPPRILPLEESELSAEQWRLVEEMRMIGREVRPGSPRNLPVPKMIATMLRHPAVYEGHLKLAQQLTLRGLISPRDRELVILRTAWLCQCGYEWGEHVQVGKVYGLRDEEIEWLIEGSSAPGWDAPSRALLRAAEEIHADAAISDATWAALAERFDDMRMIELVMVIGQYRTVAYYQNSLKVRLDGANRGLAAR